MDETIRTISSDELVKMLTDAISIYGNRPVFVEVNDKRYIINDLEFTANGKDFKLILN